MAGKERKKAEPGREGRMEKAQPHKQNILSSAMFAAALICLKYNREEISELCYKHISQGWLHTHAERARVSLLRVIIVAPQP